MPNWKSKETQARREIEANGFAVLDANIVFRANCPNIDLIVFAKTEAFYVQVKSSEKPAGKDSVVIDGSPWTEAQLQGAAIFNKHDDYKASLVIIVDRLKTGETNYYIAPPATLEELVRGPAKEFASRPKRDGTRRSIDFRKELPRKVLKQWHNAWHLFAEGLLRLPQSN
jgi:Holliday junction resolvase-like predicted endonuclease